MIPSNLTIERNPAQQKVLDSLLAYNSQKELEERITTLFTPEGDAESILRYGFEYRYEDKSGCTGLTDCLRGLPAEHEVVREILKQGNRILAEAAAMPAAELRTRTGPHGLFAAHTPIYTAFNIADFIRPEEMYGSVQKSSYHILQEHLAHPKALPYDVPVSSAIRGMMGYTEKHPRELLQFAHFLNEHKVGDAYMLRLYAELGNTNAVTVFIQALAENRPDIDFKVVGRRIKRVLTEKHQVPLQYFEEQSTTISDVALRHKYREYLQLGEE